LAANSAWAKLVCFMIVPGRFDCRGFDFNKSRAQAELISVSLGSKAGLDVAAMLEVLSASTGSSRALTEILARALQPGSNCFGAHLSIVQKDVSLGISEASALGVTVPALDTVHAVWTAAAAGKLANQDLTSILRYIEQQADTEVRIK